MSTSAGIQPITASRSPAESTGTLPGPRGGWIDHHPFRAFALLSIFYFAVTAAISSLKLLWLDELITVNMARLGSVPAIYRALAAGADPNPPLTHILVLASSRLFGAHAYAYRLPAILGYWAGLLGLFVFLKKRVPAIWGLTGVLICMGMGGFEWSFDSRSYAIFFGTTMLALLCWTLAADPQSRPRVRRLALLGIAGFLAMGLCTNYFSVLAVVPIALGELVRTFERTRASWSGERPGAVPRGLLGARLRALFRAIDWPVWLALLVAGTPLLAFRTAIATSIALYGPYAWNKVYFGMAELAYMEMVEAMLIPMGLLFVFAATLWILSRPCDTCRARLLPRFLQPLTNGAAHPRPGTVPGRPYEVAAVLVLMLYPYLGWAVASLHGGMLSSRMVIPVGLGFAIGAVCVGYRTFGQVRRAGAITFLLFLLWFLVRESYIGYSYNEQKAAFYATIKALRTVDDGHEPLVISDNMLVAPFYEYAPADMKSRVVYPMDVPAIMRYRHQASGEVNFWVGRDAYGFPIVPLAPFQNTAGNYLILTSGDDWLVDALNEHHYRVDYLPVDTHAESLNFITSPLSRYKPVFFQAHSEEPNSNGANGKGATGDQASGKDKSSSVAVKPPTPVPFTVDDELPHPFKYDGAPVPRVAH